MQETEKTWVWPLGGEEPLEKDWQSTPVFLLRQSHGQRSLVVYSPWGHKELGMTEHARKQFVFIVFSNPKLMWQ